MKKNLAMIFLLLGAVALNMGVLCQAHAGARASDGKAAVMAAVRNASAMFAEHDGGGEIRSVDEASRSNKGGCACGADDSGTEIQFSLSVPAPDLYPGGASRDTLAVSAQDFSSTPSLPQDRPPRLSA